MTIPHLPAILFTLAVLTLAVTLSLAAPYVQRAMEWFRQWRNGQGGSA